MGLIAETLRKNLSPPLPHRERDWKKTLIYTIVVVSYLILGWSLLDAQTQVWRMDWDVRHARGYLVSFSLDDDANISIIRVISKKRYRRIVRDMERSDNSGGGGTFHHDDEGEKKPRQEE